MSAVIRTAIALVSLASTYCFVFWMSAGLLFPLDAPLWIAHAAGAVAALLVACFVWARTSAASPGGLLTTIGIGACVTGAIGFALGFFGPILFMPDANQGPLLGLFFTGPLGFVLRAAGGGVVWLVRRRRGTQSAHDGPGAV